MKIVDRQIAYQTDDDDDDITALDIELFFLYSTGTNTIIIYMTDSPCRRFTACIKKPNTGSF